MLTQPNSRKPSKVAGLFGTRASPNCLTYASRHLKATDILRSAGDRALVIADDINEKLFKKTPRDVTEVPFPGAEMYSVPRPDGDWSYTNPSGTGQSQIDHVLHTSRIRINQVSYRYEVDGIALAAPGPLKKVSLSDHAALTFTAQLA